MPIVTVPSDARLDYGVQGFGAVVDIDQDDLGFLDDLIGAALGQAAESFGLPGPVGAAAGGVISSSIKSMLGKGSKKKKKAAAKKVEKAAAEQIAHLNSLEKRLVKVARKLRKERRLGRKRRRKIVRLARKLKAARKALTAARSIAQRYLQQAGEATREAADAQQALKAAESKAMLWGAGGAATGLGLGLMISRR